MESDKTHAAKNNIIGYDNFFADKDWEHILKTVSCDRWKFGHGSLDPSDPKYSTSFPFWMMDLTENAYFTDYLLNIIRRKINLDFSLYTVYANGHTYGTKGSYHQDWYEDNGKTFLLYANSVWDDDWGGKTAFRLDDEYYFNVPKPNSAILFPGVIPHRAEETSRSFLGLRVTIAWKLILK